MQQRECEGYSSYQVRSPCLFRPKEKSAEVMVVGGLEPSERMEASQSSEGPNVTSFPIQQGGSMKTCQPYFKGSRLQLVKRAVVSTLAEPLYTRDPFVQWWERCTLSPTSGRAIYSIAEVY